MQNFRQLRFFFNLIKEPTCFKGPPIGIYLVFIDRKSFFKISKTFTIRISNFHKLADNSTGTYFIV